MGALNMSSINEFYAKAHLDDTNFRINSTKRTEQIYAEIFIASCKCADWWYKDFIGQTCLVKLNYRTFSFGKRLTCCDAVRLNKHRIVVGRSFDIDDIIIC